MSWGPRVSKQQRAHLVSALEKAVLSRDQGPSVPRDVDGRVAILDLIRVRGPLQCDLLATASFADLNAARNRDTISFYVVPPKDLRRKRKIWSLLKNRCGIRDTSQVFATHTRGGRSQRTRSSERRTGAMVVLESSVEDVQCLLVRWRHSCHFRCQNKRP